MRRNWTEDEVRRALALYLRLPFGRFHKGNKDIRHLAEQIGRTPSAVALKLSNLAALDDSLPQSGMSNASAMDRAVWAEFLANPDKVIETTQSKAPDKTKAFAERQAHFEGQQGTVRTQVSKARNGQAFFREMILTSYEGACALTGANDPRLLIASHIIGWAEAPEHRLKPTNGICLNALHDRAFDRHLITFDENDRLLIADDVPNHAQTQLLQGTDGTLNLPSRFLPDPSFLEQHRRKFFDRQAA